MANHSGSNPRGLQAKIQSALNGVQQRFGMSASKPAGQSPQTAILAAAKRTITRQKRGTMGKRQKASTPAK